MALPVSSIQRGVPSGSAPAVRGLAGLDQAPAMHRTMREGSHAVHRNQPHPSPHQKPPEPDHRSIGHVTGSRRAQYDVIGVCHFYQSDFGNHHRAVFMRPQRAKIIRNRLGKHWHNTIGKIDRIAAFARFLIKRAVRADVMRYIGNGNKKTPTAIFAGSAKTASSKSRASARQWSQAGDREGHAGLLPAGSLSPVIR
jgi:hypothetical protein